MDKEQKIDKLRTLMRHIEDVIKNCEILGFRLIEDGDFELGLRIIANGYTHDQSKFKGIEWLHLTKPDDDDEMLSVVIKVHNTTNTHHPEYWGGIKNMPQAYIAEMVCDWKARSSELGTDLKEWIETKATKKYNFSKKDKVYKDILRYVELLLEPGL